MRFDPDKPLTTTLAPATLDEVQGQETVIARLKSFARRPYPCAFIFNGATGVGKNCTARALAGALGCVIEGSSVCQQIGGYWDLCGSRLTAADVQDRVRSCHYSTLAGSGWRLIVISEADKMKAEAVTEWLFALDNLPSRTVFVFTTNSTELLDGRFWTRCEQLEFESRAEVLEPLADRWMQSLWEEAGQSGPAPRVVEMPGAIRHGYLSYRACVIGLQSRLP